MKKYLLILIVSAFIFGCKDHESENKIAMLQHEKDSLQSMSNAKDSSINTFVNSFNDIETNLDSVKKHQSLITLSSRNKGEMSSNAKDRINEDIKMINELMDENKKKLAYLNEKLRQSDYKMSSLEKMISTLKAQLISKDSELVDLNKQLLAVNANVVQLKSNIAELKATGEKQTQTINDQTSQLNTAYYVVGTYKDLKAKKVLDKDGGLLGIGSTEKVKVDFNQNAFTRIDITQTNNITIESKKAELITTHPASSYKLEKNDKKVFTKLVITNPDKFWEASKYLVIVTD
jgi:DNA repair exonuclease SbcCD ATPase subunit